MAQKRISRARKRDLEQPDEFITLTSRFLNAVSAHWKPISAVVGGLMVVLVGVLIAGYFSGKAEDKAEFLLTQTMNRYTSEISRQEPGTALDAVTADFETLFSDYGDRQAGAVGRLMFAQLNYQAGRMETAILQYETVLGQFPEGSYRAAAAWSGLGYAHAAAGEHQKAITAFSSVMAGEDPILKADALYQLALLYRKTGQDKAYEQALQTLKEDYPDFIYAEVLPPVANAEG